MSSSRTRAIMLVCDVVAFCLLITCVVVYDIQAGPYVRPSIRYLGVALALGPFGVSALMSLTARIDGKWKSFQIAAHSLIMIGPIIVAWFSLSEYLKFNGETSPMTAAMFVAFVFFPLHFMVTSALAIYVAYHNRRFEITNR